MAYGRVLTNLPMTIQRYEDSTIHNPHAKFRANPLKTVAVHKQQRNRQSQRHGTGLLFPKVSYSEGPKELRLVGISRVSA